MIYYLKGEVTEKEEDFIVIDVGGVGYKVFVSEETKKRLQKKEKVFCFVHFTGNNMRVYGFKEKENLSFFRDLLKISGIGPKTAMQIASIAPMKEFKEAIEREDKEVMKKIFKIGKKKGERVIFELSRKQVKKEKDEAFDVLKGLGFDADDIEKALEKIDGKKEREERVQEALKMLDKK